MKPPVCRVCKAEAWNHVCSGVTVKAARAIVAAITDRPKPKPKESPRGKAKKRKTKVAGKPKRAVVS